MVDHAIKRIRPADFELSQVQDNLANAIDSVLTAVKKGALRRTLQMGTFWVGSNPMPTTDAPMQRTITNAGGDKFQVMAAFEVMPTAGSVLSLQGGGNGGVNGKWTLTLYVENKASLLTSSSTTPRIHAQIPQGMVKYNAGDLLAVFIRGDASINQSFSASIDVESQA